MKYTTDLVSVLKRENNLKRKYLLLNKAQGKHYPAMPLDALEMFECLGKKIEPYIKKEKILVIGFAETATAIGTKIAMYLNTLCMQTTREDFKNLDYIFFSEEHSHATEQKIIKNDLDLIINEIDRIVFAEDELTTGNTIINGVKAIRKIYPESTFKFSVVSMLNCMNEEHLQRFENEQVSFFYLMKDSNENYEKQIEHITQIPDELIQHNDAKDISIIEIPVALDLRRLTHMSKVKEACDKMLEIFDSMLIKNKDILVLGTEEFMYPGLVLGSELQQKGNTVHFHATTRSPIMPSDCEGYAITKRHTLKSLYDINRVTYIYNVRKYDEVIIVTDAKVTENLGLEQLVFALKDCGNEKITVLGWKRNA